MANSLNYKVDVQRFDVFDESLKRFKNDALLFSEFLMNCMNFSIIDFRLNSSTAWCITLVSSVNSCGIHLFSYGTYWTRIIKKIAPYLVVKRDFKSSITRFIFETFITTFKSTKSKSSAIISNIYIKCISDIQGGNFLIGHHWNLGNGKSRLNQTKVAQF